MKTIPIRKRSLEWLLAIKFLWAQAYASNLDIEFFALEGIPTYGKYLPYGVEYKDWINIHQILESPEKYPFYSSNIKKATGLPVLLRKESLAPLDGIFRIARAFANSVEYRVPVILIPQIWIDSIIVDDPKEWAVFKDYLLCKVCHRLQEICKKAGEPKCNW